MDEWGIGEFGSHSWLLSRGAQGSPRAGMPAGSQARRTREGTEVAGVNNFSPFLSSLIFSQELSNVFGIIARKWQG